MSSPHGGGSYGGGGGNYGSGGGNYGSGGGNYRSGGVNYRSGGGNYGSGGGRSGRHGAGRSNHGSSWRRDGGGDRHNKQRVKRYCSRLPREERIQLLYNLIQGEQIQQYMHLSLEDLQQFDLGNLPKDLAKSWQIFAKQLNDSHEHDEKGGSSHSNWSDRHHGNTAQDHHTDPYDADTTVPPVELYSPILHQMKMDNPIDANINQYIDSVSSFKASGVHEDPLKTLLPPAASTLPPGQPRQKIPPPEAASEPLVPPPGTADINWIPHTDGSLGQFFINAVYVDKAKTQTWQPSHFVDRSTKICKFEDLAPAAGLQLALLSEDRQLDSVIKDNCLDLLPAGVPITLLCGQDSNSRPLPPQSTRVIPCSSCKGQQVSEPCAECRQIQVQTVKCMTRDYQCKFILLRYSHVIRFIVAPACLSRLAWERFGLFGWYCDLPIKSSEQIECLDQSAFGNDLENFLKLLGVNISDYLGGADYSVLSPAVQMVYTVKDLHDPSVLLGSKKLDMLQKNVYWPQHTEKQCVCVTCGLGSNSGVYPILSQIFKFSRPQSNLKIVYPSMRVLNGWAEKLDLELTMEKWSELYRNRDHTFMAAKYIHDLECSEGVPPKANVYTQYQVEPDSINPDHMRHYGWVLTGSPSVGEGSWGTLRSGAPRYYRTELAVGLFPYTEDTDKGPVVYSADLSVIGHLFHNPRRYEDLPAVKPIKHLDHMYHTLERVSGRQAGKLQFTDHFSEGHCLYDALGNGSHNHYPRLQTQKSSILTQDCLRVSSINLPPAGPMKDNVLECFSTMDHKGPRIQKILRFFNNVQEACDYYGIVYKPETKINPRPEPDLSGDKFIGRMGRHGSKDYGFITELRHNSALRKLAPENMITDFCGKDDKLSPDYFVHADACPNHCLPTVHSFVIFSGHEVNMRGVKNHRALKLFHSFGSELEALDHLGVPEEDRKDYERLASRIRQDKEDEMARQLQKQFENINVKINKSVLPSQQDLETNFAMRATRMSSDMDWLNKHFKWVCNGEFPKRLEGAHSEYIQSSLISAMKNKHMLF